MRPNASLADPRRPRRPPKFPVSPPLDLRADVAEAVRSEKTNVGEEVLSAAKSLFHAVLPKQSETFELCFGGHRPLLCPSFLYFPRFRVAFFAWGFFAICV